MIEPAAQRRSGNRWVVIGGIAVLGVLLLYGALWFAVTGRMMLGIPPFITTAAMSGWQIQTGPAGRAGLPMAATVRLPDVVATRSFGDLLLRWTAGQVDISVLATDPEAFHVAPAGPQTLGVFSSPPTAGANAVPFTVEAADLRLSPTSPAEFRIDNLVTSNPAGTNIRIATASGRFGPVSAGASASGITLTPPLATPFDGTMAASARVVVNIPLAEAATPREAAAAWQAVGGQADIPAFTFDWGPVHATGTGSGGLDANLQPEGNFTLQVTGVLEVLDAAARGGLIASGPAAAARGVLGLLVLAERGGPVSLPIEIRDRTLTIAKFPLLRLPALDWNIQSGTRPELPRTQ